MVADLCSQTILQKSATVSGFGPANRREKQESTDINDATESTRCRESSEKKKQSLLISKHESSLGLAVRGRGFEQGVAAYGRVWQLSN